ncbi:putative aldouronate transport system permease protein [Paenibacillus sp. 1_12]|uniref:carbohydrate ABC transporter permease n=1 Tax=Paenibacillus sp. 1_12 TaxID=1566278 RepID=UPI0008F3769B|nr:carbohydrate ABC transporter permease [Paenibacillus sp. 1_12]SFK99255.1 putative aldouronate transport system permease protein [Paenibacillus sp. 1_12]
MVQDKSLGSRVFDGINYTLLTVFSLITVLPFIYIVAGSITTSEELTRRGVVLFPTVFSWEAYRYIFSTGTLVHSLLFTVYLTILGTLMNLFFTSLMAYPLAKQTLFGRRAFMLMIVFTILFNGGLIPTFLVVKQFYMLDTIWALIIPGLISAFNLIILKNFFQQLPEGLEESAKIDGCSDVGIFFRIVLPLSTPALATFSLFYAVGHWNSYFQALIYMNDSSKWPIQVLLRQIVIMAQGGIGDAANIDPNFVLPPVQTIKMAVIVVATVPILIVYPFLQKHFAKGVLLGSVKG